MRKRLPGLRLAMLLVFMVGMLSPFAATGAGAQELTCDDFNSQRAAQAVLEAEPSLEDSLDADGDGVACNEDEPVDEPGDDPSDDPTDDPTEEPTDDPADEPSGDAEADAYLTDIQDEVDALQEQVDRFVELDSVGADATQDDADEINDIAADWVEYPDVAAEFVAPAGLEDVEDAYLDLADTVGEAGELWEAYWAIDPDLDEEEEIALAAFSEEFISAQDQIVVVSDLIEEAGGAIRPSVDPAEEPSADGDAYVEDVQAELDALTDQVDRFDEIQAEAASGDLTQGELEDAADEINDIAAGWVEYPDVAFELVAPEGLEDIEDAYLDLADAFGAAGEDWETYWAIPRDDPEEDAALQDFQASYADAQDLIGEVQDLLDDAGGSTGPSTDDPTEEPTEEPSGGAGDYLATVGDTAADWQDSIDRFTEIIGLGGEATDDDNAELADILIDWSTAPEVAADVEAPAGLEDIQAAYEDFADELASASDAIVEYLATDLDSPEADAAFDDFITAIENAEDLAAELDDLLADAGA